MKQQNPKVNEAFLIYYELGKERGLRKVEQVLNKSGTKITLATLGSWSSDYGWVKRVGEMDMEVAKKTEELAVKNATVKKSLILQAVQKTFIRYIKSLENPKNTPDAGDFKKMWEIMRVELGMDSIQPTQNTYVQINQKILNVITNAESETAKALLEDIDSN